MFISLFVLPRSLYSHCHGLPKNTITEFETALKPNSSLGWRVLLASGKKIAQAVGGLGSRLQCELEIYANINSKSFSYLRNKVETPLLHHAIHCCSISCLKKIKPKKFWKGPKEYNNNNKKKLRSRRKTVIFSVVAFS